MPVLFRRHVPPARAATLAAIACLVTATAAHAHAVVGDRIFPATMTVDDPGVDDEFDTQFGHIRSPDDNGDNMNVNTMSYEWDKTITRNWQFSVSGDSARVSAICPTGLPTCGRWQSPPSLART